MSHQQVEVKVEVSAITPQYKRDRVSFRGPLPAPRKANSPEIDPNYVSVQLLFQGEENRVFLLNMFLGSDYVNKLNLAVGDRLTLK